jgi:hypothetical protein
MRGDGTNMAEIDSPNIKLIEAVTDITPPSPLL